MNLNIFETIWEFIKLALNSNLTILILFFLVFSYHFIFYFLSDKKKILSIKNNTDPDNLYYNDLFDKPLVNFIIPAWKEGKMLLDCLKHIENLKYSNYKVLINAGGDQETIEIANSYKNKENFVITYQKKGDGKIKAINECLKYVDEGIIYLLDADFFITDEILVRMMYPLTNKNESVIISKVKPYEFQQQTDLVKYIFIDRNRHFKIKFTRYRYKGFDPNACLKYDVIRLIDGFYEKLAIGDGQNIEVELRKKKIRLYQNSDYRSYIFTYFPSKLKKYFAQNIRWRENALFYWMTKHKITVIIKFILLCFLSFFIIIFPFLILINLNLFLLGFIIMFGMYLKKLRKIIFYKKTIKKEYQFNLSVNFHFKVIFYIYMELILTIVILFELIFFGKKKLKKRKNII